MAVKLEVYKDHRIVPIRFERAKHGDPDINFPDIDDRGHAAVVPEVNGLAASDPVRGPVIGMIKDQAIKIRMVRELIDKSAPLHITSSDTDVVTVVSPAAGKPAAKSKNVKIELKGGHFAGATPKSAKIEVRFNSATGPILHELTVYVFNRLPVIITPHVVTINGPTGTGGSAPSVNVGQVMDMVKAIWACCGVTYVVQPTRSWAISLPTANQMRGLDDAARADINGIIGTNWQANSVNVYFVKQISDACGYGFSKATHAGWGVNHPSVFLGERCGGTARSTYWWANDFAHELGHFFTLSHPSDGPPATRATWCRFETWCMRFLMHNNNKTFRPPDPPPQFWDGYNDFGYGDNFRGAMIPFKNVRTGAGAGRDAHCSTARNHIAGGNLY